MYLILNQFDLSKTHFKNSLKLRESIENNTQNLVISWFEYGLLLNEKGKYLEALNMLDNGMKLISKKNIFLSWINDKKGEILMKIRRYDEAYIEFKFSFN